MWDFYYAQHTISLATHIALLDAGAEFRAHRLDLATKEHQQGDYLKLNPKARVPALVTPDGILTETPAMLAFVAQSHPNADLAPLDDPFAFAKLQEFCSYIASTLHVNHAHRMRGYRWVEPSNLDAMKAMQAKVPETMNASFQFIEQNYLTGPFVMGERYSIADPYLFTVSQWGKADGVDPTAIPKVMAHYAMMKERQTVQKARAEQFA